MAALVSSPGLSFERRGKWRRLSLAGLVLLRRWLPVGCVQRLLHLRRGLRCCPVLLFLVIPAGAHLRIFRTQRLLNLQHLCSTAARGALAQLHRTRNCKRAPATESSSDKLKASQLYPIDPASTFFIDFMFFRRALPCSQCACCGGSSPGGFVLDFSPSAQQRDSFRSPFRSELNVWSFLCHKLTLKSCMESVNCSTNPGRTRTCNLWFRGPTPYPGCLLRPFRSSGLLTNLDWLVALKIRSCERFWL